MKERESISGGGEGLRERERERIPRNLLAVRAEPSVGLDPSTLES